MANSLKGEAPLGPCTLAFNFGAFIELEEKTGHKVPVLLAMLNAGLGFGDLRDFVWAGLRAHHPEMGDAEVIALVDDQGFEAASGAVGKAVTAFFGSQKEKAKNPPKRA